MYKKSVIILVAASALGMSCSDTEPAKELSPEEKLANTEKKEWLVKSTSVEVIGPNGLVNTYPLALDCEIDDIWEFQSGGNFAKYDNKTKCKGEPNELKVSSKWAIQENANILFFSNWKFLNNKEVPNQKFKIEGLTDSTITLSGEAVFANTKKFTLELKAKK